MDADRKDDSARRSRREPPSPWQASLGLATAGIELAGIVVGMIGIGYLLDYCFDTLPLFLLVGAAVGIVGGMVRTVRKGMRGKRRQ